jgi:hypothetical protein
MTNPTSIPAQQRTARIEDAADGQRCYVIAPANRDLFIRTGRQVIAACNMQIRVERWLQVYEAMLGAVMDFSQSHAEAVSECYAVPRNAKTVLSIVPKSASYDFDLAELLGELQFELQKQFGNILGPIEVGQIPSWDIDRFVNRSEAERLFPIAGVTDPSI